MKDKTNGIFYNLRKNYILKKLKSKLDINIYSNLDETLKKDKEIQLVALQCIKDKNDFNLFPKDFLHENISNCSDDIQRNFISWTAYGIDIKYLSQSMKYKLVEEDNKYFSLLSPEDRKKIVLIDNELFKKLSTAEKIDLIKDKAELISLCDLITIEKNIKDISVETVFSYAKINNLELDKYYQLMQLKYDYNNPKEYMMAFSKYARDRTNNELLEFLKDRSGETHYADISFQERIYKLRNDIFLEDLLYGDMSNYIHSVNFSIPFIEAKFKELYGEGKWNEYSSLFNDKDFVNTSDILFSIINGKNSIVFKNDSKKVVDFFKLMSKSDKSDYDNATLYNEFYDLVANTYGKEALYFLKERPGLNYSDVSNIEIFNHNVLNNFRKGFIDDLLSYNFGGYTNELVEICNNPEELKSFKLLYARFSAKLGENAETMLLTFSRYGEYKEILQEVTTGIKDDSTLEKIEALCMWPKNILNVKHVSELDNLEENLSSFMEKYKKWSPEVNDVFDFKNPYDYQVFNRFAMDELYNIKGYVAENNDNLKKDSILLSNLLNEIGNQYGNGLISMYSFLIKYKNNGGNLTNCFENLYKLLNDAREYSMEYFRNHVVTDKNYIDKKVSTHSDDAESMSIYGLEVYDLGKMKVNFASHSYDMNNSVSKEDFLRMQKEYLTYDSKSSISTISAYPVVGANTDFSSNRYIFWNFKDNIIMDLFARFENLGGNDGVVSWQPKRIVSNGYSNWSLNKFQNIPEGSIGGEITFYRRKRNHDAIEREKYGGKIIPDAVSGYISPEILDAASGRFGKNIPIVLPRGSLGSEEQKNSVRRQVVETYLEMDKLNKQSGKNYHVPSNLAEIVNQELTWINQNQSKNLISYYNSLQSYLNENDSQDKFIQESIINKNSRKLNN